MKKLILLVAAVVLTISLNSCSKSDSGSGSSVSFKVNGVSKSFKTTAVTQSGFISVVGYIGSATNPTEYVSFSIPSGSTGNVMENFSYDNATDSYDAITFTSNVTTNTASSAKGTFSGTLEPFSSGSNVIVTEGKFSASY